MTTPRSRRSRRARRLVTRVERAARARREIAPPTRGSPALVTRVIAAGAGFDRRSSVAPSDETVCRFDFSTCQTNDHRQLDAFAHQAVHRRLARARTPRGHAGAKPGDLRRPPQQRASVPPSRRLRACCTSASSSADRRSSSAWRLAAQPPAFARARRAPQTRSISASKSSQRSAARLRQSQDDALQMRRQRRRMFLGGRGFQPSHIVDRSPQSSRSAEANRAFPLVEYVEDVGVAEIDLHRPAARAFAVVALEVAVDAREGDLDRDRLRRPAGHDLERWSDDPDQVAVVLSRQVGFDLPAVLVY